MPTKKQTNEPPPRAPNPTDPANPEGEGWVTLHGGNVTTVSHKGDRVRRQTSAASPAVHQLLRWLEATNVQRVPRLLEVTDEAEFLLFLPGTAVFRPWPDEVKGNGWLTELGSWLRSYHGAVRGFRLAGDAAFLWGPSEPSPEMIVCHGDLGPWNLLHRAGSLAGVIDWDLARYGDPLDDVAELALEAVPLHGRLQETMGATTSREVLEGRLERFCSAYGVLSETVLQHVPDYLQRVAEDTRSLAAVGREPFVAFTRGGIPEALDRDQSYFLKHWR